ncbi:hypothetical protein GY652_27635, partial [Escherichia coli]|nr:hypothetical protein [Escherichia coli]
MTAAALTAPFVLISPAQAQSGAAADEQDAIVVVGSRSGNKALESSAPVQLVSGEDLQ